MALPWWAWPLALGGAALVTAELFLQGPDLATVPIYVAALGALSFGLYTLGRIRTAVDAEDLRVDDARLPLHFVAEAVPLTAEEKRTLLGPEAEPLAFVIQRPWIRGAVRVDLDDPADPTPYWLISSRSPADLAAAINAGRTA